MGIILLAMGLGIILLSVWLRAARKLTVDFAAFGGIVGILLVIMGAVFPVSDLLMGIYSDNERILWGGVVLLAVGFIISLSLSGSIIKRQEQTIKNSILLQESGRKRILFVINTMGRAGAETALLNLLNELKDIEYDIFLYVLMGQGEMLKQLPPCVKVLNDSLSPLPVLTREGRKRMACTVLKMFWRNGGWCRKLYIIVQNLKSMVKSHKFDFGKLFWRTVSEGAERFDIDFNLAVAWLEGGSAYYVAEHVKAEKKVAFIHTDYENAGYTRKMDRTCWEQYGRIFAVSGKVKEKFQKFYPEYAEKVSIFHNYINQEVIRCRAKEPGGFTDKYEGVRILSVGRLAYPKAHDIAAETMKLLKEAEYRVRWYVLGEGDQREALERKITALGIEEDFLLLGAAENPYPYYMQADIFVHASWFEGRSVAIQEAQTLGCAIIASDCSGNREQIADGEDGMLCALTSEALFVSIVKLLKDKGERERLGNVAKLKKIPQGQALAFKELLE